MKRFDIFEVNMFDSFTPRTHDLLECENGDYVMFDDAEKLRDALLAMLRLYESMLECIDPRNTCYDATCIQLMNNAPADARAVIAETNELRRAADEL